MPRSAKERVDITALIRGILNGYPGNSAIFREYLQNSDDAKAKTQIFILDERQHPTDSILDPSLQDAQGPAFVAFNDGILLDKDWESLKKIHSSSKNADETQTGKNGLGFRASYHLTENPHVLSGETLMVLDPHHRFQEHPGGMDINIIAEGPNFSDQLAAFSSVNSDHPFERFNGTAFRLPLRTTMQAQHSKIKQTETSVDEIRELLQAFGTIELEQVILFLRHITKIEIRHIDKFGRNNLVGRVSITEFPATSGNFTRTTKLVKYDADDSGDIREWSFQTAARGKEEANRLMSARLDYDIGDRLTADKLSPIVELALPLDGAPIGGSLYTLLPLPIKTGFQVHVNAVFALTPDRQSLKNIAETGTLQSRERMLVEWNRFIFDNLVPGPWVDHLEQRSRERENPWSIWPPAKKAPYWDHLLLKVTTEVLRRNLPIFSTIGSGIQFDFVTLQDSSVLLAPPSPSISLQLLSALGVKVVQPPSHIFEILTNGSIKITSPVLSPSTLYRVLLENFRNGASRPTDHQVIEQAIDFLVFSMSPPTLNHLIGLPWFLTTGGSTISFGPASPSSQFVIPASDAEARLFAAHPRMLAWKTLPDKLRDLLLQPKNSQYLDVTRIRSEDVCRVLSVRQGVSPTAPVDAMSAELAWAVDFWTWLVGWSDRYGFFNKYESRISSFFLLPTISGSLRRLAEKVVHIESVAEAKAWEKIGVPTVRLGLPDPVMTLLSNEGYLITYQKSGFVPFLLDTCNKNLQESLRRDELEAIQRTIYQAALLTHVSLTPAQKRVLEKLSIFSVLNTQGGPSILNSVSGTRIHLKLGDNFPLPVQDVVYVDLRDHSTEVLARLLDPSLKLHEVSDLLRVAVDNWSSQPEPLQDRFIEHILESNPNRISDYIKAKIKVLPFVTVNGTESRVAPERLIHPESVITPLYAGEAGRIPIGRFATTSHVRNLQNLGFLPSTLNITILEERLRYLSGDISHDDQAFEKANTLVHLLSDNWKESYRPIIASQFRNRAWLPLCRTPPTLATPEECRDAYSGEKVNPALYDLVLQTLRNVSITKISLRSALGWSDRVPFVVLAQQLHRTIALPRTPDRNRRLNELIAYFGSLHRTQGLPDTDVESLRAIVDDRSWIPIPPTSYLQAWKETVPTGYALLSKTDLKHPFHHVSQEASRSFFAAMGCQERPDLQALTRELNKHQSLTSLQIYSVVAILTEIAFQYISNNIDVPIIVPGVDLKCHSIDTVYYPDNTSVLFLPKQLEDKVATHPQISRELSDSLRISTLSSLLLDLGEEIFEDDGQIAEDLVVRIQGFLREYDIRYAFNEILANADDAKATEVSVLLDCRRRSMSPGGIVDPAFESVLAQPSIILYNNSVFSEQDFKGIRQIGQGGKTNHTDTHGRYGLGSLSFYYFTDVVTIISGEHVMILDPSGRYLPPHFGFKRTSIIRTISEFARQYPNQLSAYEGVFSFTQKSPRYEGTLFCLPLLSEISPKRCEIMDVQKLLESSYKTLAENAFFFTNLSKISASMTPEIGNLTRSFWKFTATRLPPLRLDVASSSSSTYSDLELTLGHGKVEKWMVCTSKGAVIPTEHQPTATPLKLIGTNVVVRIAIRLVPELGKKSWLFSTLRLPKATSLPFHVHARFALSSNRQAIVFDSPDRRNERDPKSAFNSWILTDVLPSLYLDSLVFLITRHLPLHTVLDNFWWLSRASDEISKQTGTAFQELLAKANARLFETSSESLLSFRDAVFAPLDPRLERIVRCMKQLKAPGLVTSYASTDLPNLPKARKVDVSYVKGILLRVGCLESVQSLYRAGGMTFLDLTDLLSYVAGDGSFVGLPLLLLSSHIPVSIPSLNDPPIYLSLIPTHADLFRNARFLRPEYGHEGFQHIWSSSDVNVIHLSESIVPHLIGHELEQTTNDHEKENWLKRFWEVYDTLPGPPSLSALEIANFRFVRSAAGRHYSLQDCQPDNVVYASDSDDRRQLSHILAQLNVDVLKPTGNATLKRFLSERFPSTIVNVLKCLAKANVTDFGVLSVDDTEFFIGWLKDRFKIGAWNRNDFGIDRNHLFHLSIWKARFNGIETWHQASDLKILPFSISLSDVTPYLHPNRAIAEHSYTLIQFVEFCRRQSTNRNRPSFCMSPHEILGCLEFPSSINTQQQFRQYRAFMTKMLQMDLSQLATVSLNLRVFDSEGNSRPLHALFDHTVPLFSSSLLHTERSSFIHPRLRDLDLPVMRQLGLKHEISMETFRTCAEAIQDVVRAHEAGSANSTVDAIHEMASVAFEAYRTCVPATIMLGQASWASIDSIAFIRPKTTRRQGASYPVERYFENEAPLLVRPLDCVLPMYEPVVWTQRMLFFHEPTEDVTRVNTRLGIPDVSEVVNHLQFLTCRIAPNHPGNTILLSDIKATYKWLDERSDKAREYLLPLGQEKLLLNVDNPAGASEWWGDNWLSASQLVLNMDYDHEGINFGALRRVKNFLKAYPSLLRAAGCDALAKVTYSAETAGDVPSRHLSMRAAFNEMRNMGEMTDVVFVGQEDWPEGKEDEIPEHPELRAHRAVLAAAVPHFRAGGTGWKDSRGQYIRFYGTSFGAKAFLDFVYSGSFEYSTPQDNDNEGWTEILYELLALLDLADSWDMPDLLAHIEACIIHKHDLIHRFLCEHLTILERAKLHKARRLEDAINHLYEQNPKLMKRFSLVVESN